jgi:hypothetical protein
MQIPGNSPSAGKKPTTPIIGTAVAGSLSASVPFTPSTYIGKGTITYTATSNPSGITGTSASSPITVSGLLGGTQYTFSVVGTTNYGVPSGASDFSNPVTPTGASPFFPPFFPFFPFFPPFFPPYFPFFPTTCPVSYGPYSYTYGGWSAYSACVNNSQSRTRTVTATRTRINADCSETIETSTTTDTETQACGTPPQTTYYGCCSNGLSVSGQYASSGVAATNLQGQCAADEPGNNLAGGVYTTPQNCA